MAKYISCGNIVSDAVRLPDGSVSPPNMGGGGIFGLAGIRLWSRDCKLVCHAGADFDETYGRWLRENGLTEEGVMIDVEKCSSSVLTHCPDGSYYQENPLGPQGGAERFGYMQVKPRELESFLDADTAAVYMTQVGDRQRWKNIAQMKERTGVKVMWEIQLFGCTPEQFEEAIAIADLFSINRFEAAKLFGLEPDDEAGMIQRLKKLPVEMTFFRVGDRGAYTITEEGAYFCGAVRPFDASRDPTGCGNCSTAAAMYAWTEGFDPLMVAVMANISAGFNAAQMGPYPRFDRASGELAARLLRETYEKYREVKK